MGPVHCEFHCDMQGEFGGAKEGEASTKVKRSERDDEGDENKEGA